MLLAVVMLLGVLPTNLMALHLGGTGSTQVRLLGTIGNRYGTRTIMVDENIHRGTYPGGDGTTTGTTIAASTIVRDGSGNVTTHLAAGGGGMDLVLTFTAPQRADERFDIIYGNAWHGFAQTAEGVAGTPQQGTPLPTGNLYGVSPGPLGNHRSATYHTTNLWNNWPEENTLTGRYLNRASYGLLLDTVWTSGHLFHNGIQWVQTYENGVPRLAVNAPPPPVEGPGNGNGQQPPADEDPIDLLDANMNGPVGTVLTAALNAGVQGMVNYIIGATGSARALGTPLASVDLATFTRLDTLLILGDRTVTGTTDANRQARGLRGAFTEAALEAIEDGWPGDNEDEDPTWDDYAGRAPLTAEEKLDAEIALLLEVAELIIATRMNVLFTEGNGHDFANNADQSSLAAYFGIDMDTSATYFPTVPQSTLDLLRGIAADNATLVDLEDVNTAVGAAGANPAEDAIETVAVPATWVAAYDAIAVELATSLPLAGLGLTALTRYNGATAWGDTNLLTNAAGAYQFSVNNPGAGPGNTNTLHTGSTGAGTDVTDTMEDPLQALETLIGELRGHLEKLDTEAAIRATMATLPATLTNNNRVNYDGNKTPIEVAFRYRDNDWAPAWQGDHLFFRPADDNGDGDGNGDGNGDGDGNPNDPFDDVRVPMNIDYKTNERYINMGRSWSTHQLTFMTDANNTKLVAYRLVIDPLNPSRATVYLLEPAIPGDVLIIPLVLMTLVEGEPVTISIGNGAGMQQIPIQTIGSTGVTYGSTSSTFKEVVDAARGRIYLSDLTITERNAFVLQHNGWFFLVPPLNYDMAMVDDARLIERNERGINTPTQRGSWSGIDVIDATGGLRGTRVEAVTEFTVTNNPRGSEEQPRVAFGIKLSIPNRGAGATNIASQPANLADRDFLGAITLAGFALSPKSNDPELWTNMGDTLKVDVGSWGGAYFQPTSGNPKYQTHGGRNVIKDIGDIRRELDAPASIEGRTFWPELQFTGFGGTVVGDGGTIIRPNVWGDPGTNAQVMRAVDNNGQTWEWTIPGLGATRGGFIPARVTNATLDVAVRKEWQISYTAAPFTYLFSGRVDQASARITIEETTLHSWNTLKDTIFTVTNEQGETLEDVKISRVVAYSTNLYSVVNRERTVFGTSAGTNFWNRDLNGNKSASPVQYANASFSRDGHDFRITDLGTGDALTVRESRVNPKLELVFHLSAQANFGSVEEPGEVFIKMHGPGIADGTDLLIQSNGIVKVAEFVPPVTIITESSELQIGYQTYAVNDFRIVENYDTNRGSAFTSGDQIQITLGEYGKGRLTGYMYFAPLYRADVVFSNDPQFNISEVTMVNLIGVPAGYSSNPQAIQFTVTRKSSTVGGIIDVSNVNLNIRRDVPEGFYDLIVGGTYINNTTPAGENFLYMYDRFDVFGVVEPAG